jgi:hypothetical protein
MRIAPNPGLYVHNPRRRALRSNADRQSHDAHAVITYRHPTSGRYTEVMSGKSIEAYLDAWLPDGFY